MTCIHHYSIIQNGFTALKIPFVLGIYLSLSLPKSLAITDLFMVIRILHFPESHIVEIICGEAV